MSAVLNWRSGNLTTLGADRAAKSMSPKSLVVVMDVPVVDEHGDNGGEIFVRFCIVVCGTPLTMPIKSDLRVSSGLAIFSGACCRLRRSVAGDSSLSKSVDGSIVGLAFLGDAFACGGDKAGFFTA